MKSISSIRNVCSAEQNSTTPGGVIITAYYDFAFVGYGLYRAEIIGKLRQASCPLQVALRVTGMTYPAVHVTNFAHLKSTSARTGHYHTPTITPALNITFDDIPFSSRNIHFPSFKSFFQPPPPNKKTFSPI